MFENQTKYKVVHINFNIIYNHKIHYLTLSYSSTMLEFESLGPIKIDCFGCNDHIYVSVNNSNNNDEFGEEQKETKKMVILEKYRKMAKRIREMEVYDDDIWVISFPKCGTTWTQEMVWLLNNNLNFTEAKKVNLLQRFPFLE